MDSETVGIIGALATITASIVSPMLAQYLKKRKDEKFIPLPTIDRRSSIYGKWEGSFIQKVGKGDAIGEHSMTLNFTNNSDPIVGTAEYELPQAIANQNFNGEKFLKLKLVNTIYDGRILKTDYVNKNNNVIHFGTLYGDLSGPGNEIEGEFLGYGLFSNQFVSGTFKVNKV